MPKHTHTHTQGQTDSLTHTHTQLDSLLSRSLLLAHDPRHWALAGCPSHSGRSRSSSSSPSPRNACVALLCGSNTTRQFGFIFGSLRACNSPSKEFSCLHLLFADHSDVDRVTLTCVSPNSLNCSELHRTGATPDRDRLSK